MIVPGINQCASCGVQRAGDEETAVAAVRRVARAAFGLAGQGEQFPRSGFGRLLARVGITCVLSLVVTGCPSSGGGNEEEENPNLPPGIVLEEAREVSGRVVLPDGMAMNPVALGLLTSRGRVTVAADGSFTAGVVFRTPTLCQVVDGADRALLLGFVDPDAAEEPRIDARSTATVLLYFANAGWTVYPDSLVNVLELIGSSEAAGTLAAVIATELAANPMALHEGSEALLAALDAAHAATKFPTPPRGGAGAEDEPSGKVAPRMQSGGVSPLLLIAPDANTRQSGVQVVQNPDGEGIAAINNFRRRAKLFVYKTGTEDDAGGRRDLNPAESIEELDMPTTFRLNLISSVHAVLSGSASWAPVTTPAVVLEHDAQADKTYFEAVVVGTTLDYVGMPAVTGHPQFANYVGLWSATADALQWKMILADFVLPVIETIAWGAALSSLEAAPAAALDAFIAAQDPVLLQVGVVVPRTHAQLSAFMQAAVRSMADDAVYSASMYSLMRQVAPTAATQHVTLTTLQTGVRAAATSAALLRAIQLAMTALDLGAVISDNQSSSWAEGWEITAAPRTVHINPTSAVVEIGETRNFTATLSSPPQGTLVYEWSTSGRYGHLGDGVMQGVQVQSEYSTVVYSSDPNAPDGAMDTITVRVFLRDSSGSLILVGALEEPAEVTAQRDPVCDMLDVAPYQSGCGSLSLSSTDITAGEFMTVTVNVGCGGATLYCDYVASGTMEVDGVAVTPDAGITTLYPYDPPQPLERANGAGVRLSGGGHTVRFQIPLSAPNDCLKIDAPAFGSGTAVGPWCYLGGGSPNTWSSVAHFRVRQRGL